MSRRSRKSKNTQNLNLIPVIVGAAIAILVVVAVLFLPKIINPGADAAQDILDHESYVANSKNLVGNKYKVIGTIKSSEVLSGNGDIRLSVMPEGATKSTLPLGIFVKKEVREKLDSLNLDISSEYIFFVTVENNSFLEAYSIRSK